MSPRILALLVALLIPSAGIGSEMFGDHQPSVGPPSFSGPVVVERNTLSATPLENGILFKGDLFFRPQEAGPLTVTIPLERAFSSSASHFDAKVTLVGNAFLAPGDTVLHQALTGIDDLPNHSLADNIAVNPQFHWFRGIGPSADLVVDSGEHVLRGTVIADLNISVPNQLERLQYPGQFTITPTQPGGSPQQIPEPASLLVWSLAAASFGWTRRKA